MARSAKRAELIANAYRLYHSGTITLGALNATIASIRHNENPLRYDRRN